MPCVWKTLLLHCLISCAARTSGVRIESVPGPDDGGFIWTEPNRTVSLTCVSEAAPGAEQELVWLRNGALVKLKEGGGGGGGGGDNKGRSSLCVAPVTREDDAATFTCQTSGAPTFNSSVTLNVTYAPAPSSETEEVVVEEQDDLVLRCDMRANPPVSVRWLHQRAPLDLSAGGSTVTNDGRESWLVLGKADGRSHPGDYRCVTQSDIYGKSFRSFRVTVNEKTLKLPVMPLAAGIVVVLCTALLAVISRRNKIAQCCK